MKSKAYYDAYFNREKQRAVAAMLDEAMGAASLTEEQRQTMIDVFADLLRDTNGVVPSGFVRYWANPET